MSVSIASLLGFPHPAAKGPSCSHLETLDDFGDYVVSLDSETSFDATALKRCRPEICNAVYGTGNPDISGIGVCHSILIFSKTGITNSCLAFRSP